MPVAYSQRIRSALWLSVVTLLVPISITLWELSSGGPRPWLRLAALLIVGATLVLLLARQHSFERLMAEQERADSALRASEAKFSGILAIAADAIITVDHDQTVVHFNHGAEQIFGHAAGDVVGRHLALLLPPRYRAAHELHMEHFARAAESARRMAERREIFGLRADGTEFPAEASISKLVTEQGMLFTVVLRDVTERKRTEEDERFMAETSAALAQSLDFDATLQAVVDLAVPRLADAAFVDVVTSNGGLRRMVGRRHRESLSAAMQQLAIAPLSWDSPSPVIDVIRRRRAEQVVAVDASWLEGNEEAGAIAAWTALGARALLIVPLVAGDQMLGALTLIAVNARRSLSAETRVLAEKFAGSAATMLENARLYAVAQRANRAREEVLGVVSHDLRNPITAISMCARALDENPPTSEQARHELLTTIRESAAWTNRLIQDLLDEASLEQGRLSVEAWPSEPAQLVLQTWHMFEVEAMQHGVSLAQRLPTNLPLVMADSARIVQVLGNLVRNALKFTPSGGQITIGAEPRDGQVVFSVRDTGPGVAPEHQMRVFERYWQSSDAARIRGTGLGLSIAKGMVEAHGGTIWLESIPGQGATFLFSIPTATRSTI